MPKVYKTIKKPYIDITSKWKKNSSMNILQIEERTFVRINGKNYKINKNNKNVVFEEDIEALRPIAKWMSKTFGGKIYINPTVKYPQGIRTPDFTYKNKSWDLKTINTDGVYSIDNALKTTKGQSNNFILDLSNSKLDFSDIIKQVKKIYNNPYRPWIDILIIKRDSKFNVLKRK